MKAKGIWHLAGAALGLSLASGANAAAIIDLQVEGGGEQQVYHLSNGNYLGLWGFDARNASIQSDVTIGSASDITGGFSSGGDNIVAYYNGSTPVNSGASEFDSLSYPITIKDGDRLYNSLWTEWTGGNLVYQKLNGGTSTMSTLFATPTIEYSLWNNGDSVSVSEPGSLALLVAGFAGLGLLRRRDGKSAANAAQPA